MAEGLAAQDSDYLFTFEDGRKIRRRNLAQLILDSIGEEKKHTAQIANQIGMNYQSVFAVIRTLVTSEILISEKQHKHTVYKIPTRCGLDSIFNHQGAIDKFTVMSKKQHKMDDFPNISYRTKSGYENFSSSGINPVYEGGSE